MATAPAPATPSPATAVGTMDPMEALLAKSYVSQQQSEAEARQAAEVQSANINKELENIKKEMVPPDVETRSFDDKDMPAEAVTQDVKDANKFYVNLHKLSQPPKEELFSKADAFKKVLPFMAALAALGTLASRGNVAVGIQAMAGGLRGLTEGNRQKYEDAYNVWKSTTETAIQDNQMRVQAMKDILDDRRLTVSQQLSALSIYAKETPTLMKAVQNHDIKDAKDVVGALHQAVTTAADKHKDADAALKPPTASESSRLSNYAMSFLVGQGEQGGFLKSGQALPGQSSKVNAYFMQLVGEVSSGAAQYLRQGHSVAESVQMAYADLLKAKKVNWDTVKSNIGQGGSDWPVPTE